MWVSCHSDVMDRDKSLIDMRDTFAGANKAGEKSSVGYDESDDDLLIDLAIGKKCTPWTNSPEFIANTLPRNTRTGFRLARRRRPPTAALLSLQRCLARSA